jgi:RNA polymerase subunit RPABC4/transcription elongation factor Spt4
MGMKLLGSSACAAEAGDRSTMVRVRQHLGKYRIERRLAEGGFATVYRAQDTIAGVPVALKVPHPSLVNKETLEAFRKEVRLTAHLDHPNILPVKDAGFIEGTFFIAYPLGDSTLADRLKNRLSTRTMVRFVDQMLEAVAFAHRRRIMHCDIKPENFILFPENRLRLADFGIAKVAQRTLRASGSGTVGYLAPEQAMGKPSFRSDVFSLGLVIYRMLSGQLPEWPFSWPLPGYERLRKNVHPDVIGFLRRATAVDHRKRFKDAAQMQAAFRKLRPRALRSTPSRQRRRKKNRTTVRDWRTIRLRGFLQLYRGPLAVHSSCHRCDGPVAEAMQFCPWCGSKRRVKADETRFRANCPRCKRGIKTDWRFCPWCYGPAINPDSSYRYADARYVARCANPSCKDKVLMPFMRYCPWCGRKIRKAWKISGAKDRCEKCGWGIVPEYWDFCPWCGKNLRR